MLVSSYDGRPIKAEGNPEHPESLGALSAIAQATVLDLYDPDRSQRLVYRESGQEYVRTWDDFAVQTTELMTGNGVGFAVLSEASSSPSLRRMRQRLLDALPGATWYEYEPISRDHEREGMRLAFGRPLRPSPQLDRARIIACFDADPLADHPASLRLTREFAASRRPDLAAMSRLYVVEPSYTLTGGRADHRVAAPASRIPGLLAALAAEIATQHGVELPPGLGEDRSGSDLQGHSDFVSQLANDLVSHRGGGVILVGPRQAPEVHALAAALNEALANSGNGVVYNEDPDPDRPSHAEAIAELASRMGAGSVQTLLILGGNPAYDAPADLGFAELLDRVPNTIHLSHYDNETSRGCRWHLPRAHYLECWGDGLAWDGTWTMQQPLIEAIYGGRSAVELLAAFLDPEPVRGYDVVRETARQVSTGDFERFWRRSLHDGMIKGREAPAVAPKLDPAGLEKAARALDELPTARGPGAEGIELLLCGDARVFDGRFANNAWLQELPDPITKITWDNALLMSPVTARDLGIKDQDLVAVETPKAMVELPTAAGRVGTGVGVDSYVLRRTEAMHVIDGVTLRPTGGRYTLACTQDHHAIDPLGFGERNRRVGNLVREASVGSYLEDPELFHHMDHHPPLKQLWKEKNYEGEQWGMAIDLNACTGCNACVVACQAENNIPVVGRQQVINQREMHWLRIDRYFKTEPGVAAADVSDAEMVFQPMTCVHCENAPCEQVCPVAATQHTEDGLNAMVYNRCIGTRYCSNNCPYKVRRFNFFNYHKKLSDVTKMQFNPEVTVRSRGVMEKCTYCVQRIEAARIPARNDNRPVADGEVVPACAQTCPAKAIHFGNLNDPESEISGLRSDHRSYAALVEINVRPRTHYLARLSNPAGGEEDHDDASGHGTHGKESS
jgi:molybdopterin-containing oxidoreductase family iron-sulfur binding subunit